MLKALAGQVMRRIGRGPWAWTFTCGALCLVSASIGLAMKAYAQAPRSDNPTPSGQSYLTGDWDGVPSDLERLAVTFTLSYTNDFLTNVSGGIKNGSVLIGIFQPQVDFDLFVAASTARWLNGTF